jgi:predicted MPP superfamily phosphohydrolase
MMRRAHLFVVALALAAAGATALAQDGQAGQNGRLRFAVIGDFGTGKKPQYEVGEQMAAAHTRAPLDLVIMVGDNMYGSQKPKDYVTKFERPYAALLKAGVPFFAAFGNHDDDGQRFYAPFNMNGARYYSYVRKDVRFIVLDTNRLDRVQLEWADKVLTSARERWTIAYFHHPLYSNAGRHGSNVELRVALEPLLRRGGVDVVFSGHDHAYERFKPQGGITYFLTGSGGQLRKGDIDVSPETAASFDADQAFLVAEAGADELTFETITRTGRVIDSGSIARKP